MTNDDALLERIQQSLVERFGDVIAADTIERQVTDCYQAMYRTARIKRFLPVMAESMATHELLRILASGDKRQCAPRVLFLSEHDAGRSQMAVALMDRAWLHAVRPVHVKSAGAQPTRRIEPVVVTAMTEIGLDLTADRPRAVTPDLIATADLVVRTGETCVLPEGTRHVDWDLPDPARRALADVRRIRDDIDHRVQDLLVDLLAS